MRVTQLTHAALGFLVGCAGTPGGGLRDAMQPDVMQPDAIAGDVTLQDADLEAAIDVALDRTKESPFDADLDVAIDRADVPSFDARLDVGRDVGDVFADLADVPSFDARFDVSRDVGDVSADRTDAASDPADASTGPRVDRINPQLYSINFRANEADPMARRALGMQSGFLDTRVAPRGQLVVYLHGAGAPTTCGSIEHERLLASWGFHVIGPCYVSDYGVVNCGSDIRGCRLEAFEGIDHHPFVTIDRPDSIETRVLRALELLQRRNPAGDWGWFIEGGRPRWGNIIISGISHGASSSGVIAQVRPVLRAVMLSGPLDTGQPWLSGPSVSPVARVWGFTHRADPQHAGHVAAFAAMRLPGTLTFVDGAASPWGGTQRLASAASSTDGHGSTQAGASSPRDAMRRWVFEPVWRRMYGVAP